MGLKTKSKAQKELPPPPEPIPLQAQMPPSAPVQTHYKLLKPALYVLGFLLIAGSISTAFYFYKQYQSTQQLLRNPNQISSAQLTSVLNRVNKIMELPSGETPQIATVVDKNKLKSQPFFSRAQNGDQVLIYAKAKEAILYRPSSNKIIEVAPLNISTPSASQDQGHVAGTSTTVTKAPTPAATITPTATSTPTPTPTTAQ